MYNMCCIILVLLGDYNIDVMLLMVVVLIGIIYYIENQHTITRKINVFYYSHSILFSTTNIWFNDYLFWKYINQYFSKHQLTATLYRYYNSSLNNLLYACVAYCLCCWIGEYSIDVMLLIVDLYWDYILYRNLTITRLMLSISCSTLITLSKSTNNGFSLYLLKVH